MTKDSIKLKRPRRRITDLAEEVNHDAPIVPEAQIYTSRIDEYRKIVSREEWRNELDKEEDIPEKPSGNQPKKRTRRRRKVNLSDDIYLSDSDEENAARLLPPLPSLEIESATLPDAAMKRLDRLKRAAQLEIKRLKEERIRVLAETNFTSLDSDVELVEDDNSEILLRVRYIMDVFRVRIKKNEKFSVVMPEIAKNCASHASEILLFLKDTNITVDDTPGTLGISIADVIDCCVYKPCESEKTDVEDSNRLEIKIQSSDCKKIVMYVHKLECMQSIMEKYAKQRNIPLKKLIFEFDGEKITGTMTPEDLEMENESCVDVRVLT